ncbi:MAG: hypothetical protein QOH88_48 [Verrucomicrobiota bacterium]|jgi:mono/diheme cytochrome c family protein
MTTTRTLSGLLAVVALLLAGCESTTSNAPPISPALISAGSRQYADARLLTEGRSLLLDRCIQCHALPETAKFPPDRLRVIVATMAGRANLKAGEREAVLQYLLAARSL